MGIFDWGKNIAEPIKAVGTLYTTDKERLDAEAKLEEIEQKPILSQLSNNAIMAADSNFFNSGWQPLIGWSCGLLVLLYYAPQIIVITYVWGKVCIATATISPFPMKPDDLLNLVYLLFGFGGYSLARKRK